MFSENGERNKYHHVVIKCVEDNATIRDRVTRSPRGVGHALKFHAHTSDISSSQRENSQLLFLKHRRKLLSCVGLRLANKHLSTNHVPVRYCDLTLDSRRHKTQLYWRKHKIQQALGRHRLAQFRVGSPGKIVCNLCYRIDRMIFLGIVKVMGHYFELMFLENYKMYIFLRGCTCWT